MAQSVLLNSSVALAGRLATLVLGLGATALMTRLLGAQEFGQYAFVATIGTFLQLVADFGLYLTASRELGRGLAHTEIQFGHILSLRSMFLVGVYIVGGITLVLIPSTRAITPLFAVFATGFAAQSVSQLLLSVFQASGVVWRATISDIAGRCAQIGTLFMLFIYSAHMPVHAIGVASAFSIGLAVSCVMYVVLVPNKKMLIPVLSPVVWRKIIKISLPIGALLVLNVIYFKIDTVMLALFRTSQEVGWYALAYRMVENTLFFPAMLGGLLLPHISSALHKKDHALSRGFIEQSLFLSISLALPIVAILVLYAKEIVVLISGQVFAPSGPILAVLAWAAGIMFVGNILGFALIALGRQRELLVLYTGLAIGNILANLVFIPLFGAIGAAWITVITEGIATAVASYLVYERIPWSISSQYLYKLLFCILVAIGCSYALPAVVPLLVRIIIVCAVYLILGYTNGVWSPSMTNLLRAAKGV